jgi:DNA-binding MarR family transcriptional regulator
MVKSELVRALEHELAAQQVQLRFSQMQALKRLYHQGAMSAGELARALGHDGGALTRLLDQLEEKNYLRRQPDPQDRRALRIELTASGSELCRELDGCSRRVMAAAQQSLDKHEQERLIDYLQRILITLRDPD